MNYGSPRNTSAPDPAVNEENDDGILELEEGASDELMENDDELEANDVIEIN